MIRHRVLARLLLAQISAAITASYPIEILSQEIYPSHFDDVVIWNGNLRLQDVWIEMLPVVEISTRGEVIVAELKQRQIRKHDVTGRLLWAREDILESGSLSGALWIPGDSVIGYSASGSFLVLDSGGVSIRSGQTGLRPLYAAQLLNDTTAVLAGRFPGTPDASLLHLWDLRRQQIIKGFFSVPSHDARLNGAYDFSGSTSVAIRGDTIAATFARADTVYLFRADGVAIEKVHIPFIRFRFADQAPPNQLDSAFVRWRNSFSSVSQVFWAPDGSFFIQYFNMLQLETQWSLLHMTRDGRLLFDAESAFRLLAIFSDGQLLFLDTRDVEQAGRWKIADLRPGY
jgi:hypothetical protein